MKKGLFSAVYDGDKGILYSDPNSSEATNAFIAICGAKTKNADVVGYVAICDVSFTCGSEPVQKVEKVESPEAVEYEIADGVFVNGAIYYRFAQID